jgi:hypothetical protein
MRKATFTAALAPGVYARQGGGESSDASSTISTTSAQKESSSSSNAVTPSSSTPSVTSSTAPSSPTHTLSFYPPPNTTTCGVASFTWSATAMQASVPLTIQVMNATMAMSVLTQHVPITASRMDWQPVDVDVGTYTIMAWDSNRTLGLFAQSAPFNVTTGADRSCLAELPSANASSASQPPSTASQKPNQALVVALCLISATLLVLALAVCGFVFRRYYYTHRQTRRRPGGPRYLF